MKRKVKTLTLAEIKEKMVHLGAEHWVHSPPLFGLLPTTEGLKLLPLSPLAETGLLVVFVVDMVDYSFSMVLESIEKLRAHLRNLPWEAVILSEEKYTFIRNPGFLDRYRMTRSFSSIPLHYDQKGDWTSYFKAESGPRVAVLYQGNEVMNLPMLPDLAGQLARVEQQLHDALRIEDPGLPLPEIVPATFTRPSDRRKIPAQELILNGTWIQAAHAVASEDSQAAISFPFQGFHVRLIAALHGNAREAGRISISFNDEPLPSAHFGPATRQGEKGVALAEISRNSGIFEIIHSAVEMKGTLKIRFLNAVENPVIIYGVRVA